jgi:hypothetical protein
MRLMDLIVQSRANVIVDIAEQGRFVLPGAGLRAGVLADTPLRYILSDDVRSLCSQIMNRWPEMLDPSDLSLRVPVEGLWMEWCQALGSGIAAAPLLAHHGLLVQADRAGRRGTLESFWLDPVHGVERSQVLIEFDFDEPIGEQADERRSFAMPAPCPARVARHARLVVDSGWRDYFGFTSMSPDALPDTVRQCAALSWTDLPMLLAFLRLLATRAELTERPIERAPLNVQRSKSGKPPLLDHVELTLKVGGGSPESRPSSFMHTRSDPRLHLVRGHVFKRGTALFWRSAHLRGRPDLTPISTRTYNVVANSPKRARNLQPSQSDMYQRRLAAVRSSS